MATVQSYTKAGVDAKIASRSNMNLVYNGSGTPTLSAFPDAKTGDVITRKADGDRWEVIAQSLSKLPVQIYSVNGKTGTVILGAEDVGAADRVHNHTIAQITDLTVVEAATASTTPKRTTAGQLIVQQTPTAATHAASKAYVDSTATAAGAIADLSITAAKIANKTITEGKLANNAVTNAIIANGAVNISSILSSDLTSTLGSGAANKLVQASPAGTIEVPTPTANAHPSTKQYVDNAIILHKHGSVDITDGVNTPNGTTAQGDKVVKTLATGFLATSAVPTSDNHVVNYKFFSDQMSGFNSSVQTSLNGKANSSHTHTSANITDSTNLPNGATGTGNQLVKTTSGGKLQGNYTPTTGYDLVNFTALTNGLNGKANSSHNHTSMQISDATNWPDGTTNTGDKVVRTISAGKIQVNYTPTYYADVVNLKALDAGLATKANSSHTHTSANITDSTNTPNGTDTRGNILVKTTPNGRLNVAYSPSASNDVVNKAYVDTRTPQIVIVKTLPTVPASGVIYIVTG